MAAANQKDKPEQKEQQPLSFHAWVAAYQALSWTIDFSCLLLAVRFSPGVYACRLLRGSSASCGDALAHVQRFTRGRLGQIPQEGLCRGHRI